VVLRVGEQEYLGEGTSLQAARHCAASIALPQLRSLPSATPPQQSVGVLEGGESEGKSEEATEERKKEASKENDMKITEEVVKNSNKSVISQVHEIALKRNLAVCFEVLRESGPPHLRLFSTRCVCGDLVTEGEAHSKQLSKQKAAEDMLQELAKLPALSTAGLLTGNKAKKHMGKTKQTKNKSLVKLQKTSPDYGVGINPISRLAQVQQAKKDREPAYKMLEERGLPRCREFVMQVTIDDHECVGAGSNKKLAKRHAAEQMLELLGYSKPTPPQPARPAIRQTSTGTGTGVSNGMDEQSVAVQGGEKKVKFRDLDTNVSAQARQLIPGVIVMPGGPGGGQVPSPLDDDDPVSTNDSKESYYAHKGGGGTSCFPLTRLAGTGKCPQETTAAIVEQFMRTGTSSIMEAMMQAEHRIVSGGPVHLTEGDQTTEEPMSAEGEQAKIRPKDQLLYLASVMGFHVQFTDFPKGNKTHYLSIATLSTNPPQHSHGSAPTIDEANDNAALHALRNLAELGLDGMGRGLCPGSGCGPIKTELG